MKQFLLMQGQNDNIPTLEKTDITEVLAEILCNGKKLLDFTSYLESQEIISLQEKGFLDEIFGNFGSFDEKRKTYSAMECRGFYQSISKEFQSLPISHEYSFLSDPDFERTFEWMFQAEINSYLEEIGERVDISRVSWNLSEIAMAIIWERKK